MVALRVLHMQMADADEKWEALLRSREEWTNRPVQPPGLGRSGIMEVATAMVDLRRRKQAAAAGNGNGAVSNAATNGAARHTATVHA